MRVGLPLLLAALQVGAQGEPPRDPGATAVVCHVRVLSDKVEDVSSLEAWRNSFIKEGMTDEQKALAVWKTVFKFQHQDEPPAEYLGWETDPIRIFNVYGYAMCGQASGNVEALSRFVGLASRGRSIHSHQVAEVSWDGAWHLLDASLINYFPKADGKLAAVDEIVAGIKEWGDRNPGVRGNDPKMREFMRGGGWRRGPEVLSRCPTYDENGWLPAATHGWYSTMQEYDGSSTGIYEHGYSQGYQVNIQLRPGMRLTRNWAHKGLHVNMKDGGAPGCLNMKVGQDSLRYTPRDGDLANGRVGNGAVEYDVPAPLLQEATRSGALTLRMPSSYVYLTGKLTFKATAPVSVSFSDNHGLDWKEIAQGSGAQEVDLSSHVLRRYEYRLRLELKGARLESAKIVHDIQHSQRPLPALGPGKNTITFSAGPPEGTVTIEGSTDPAHRGKQLLYADFHPEVKNVGEPNIHVSGGKGEVTFRVATPGEMTRLRFGAFYRARDPKDGWDYQVSFDGGKAWKTVDRAGGPTSGNCKYAVCSEIPAGTREAWVRFASFQAPRNATMIFNSRIDADYKEPFGGFRPVKVTYLWEENGQAKQDVHVARKPQETYVISCAAKPIMKSIVLELAE